MRRAVRYADGWLPYVYSPEQLSRSIETLKGMGAEQSRNMSNFRFGIYIFASVYADGNEALRSVREAMPAGYFKDFARDAERSNLFGDPDYCPEAASRLY
jgi:alkanesulfonate monooxygenase SsuD/methylene tetrahydromethanopterin reductase-like flavin-dependent oxidoreductase (luciferase family)